MSKTDVIKTLCKEKKISLAQLEKDLGMGNGSLAKAEGISAQRLYMIAKYFDISMEYIITGEYPDEYTEESAIIKRQQDILLKMVQTQEQINSCYKEIARLRLLKEKKYREYQQLTIQNGI